MNARPLPRHFTDSVLESLDHSRVVVVTGAFLLTGSFNLLRMRAVSETLAGRAAYVELGPLGRVDDASLDHRTSTRYLDLLEIGYQLRTLTPYAAAAAKRLTKMPKTYARESSMATCAAGQRVGRSDRGRVRGSAL